MAARRHPQLHCTPVLEGKSPYPEHAAFIDAESPHAGHEITRAFDEGYAVVLVSADGRERVITAKRSPQAPERSPCPRREANLDAGRE